MDVRCSRCGVEYEFDDEKVSPAGVTVKCTSCGHVFKVKRSSPEESAPFLSASSGEGWMVRNRDGTVMRFKELTTLQKWIVEQKVGNHDEISRTGRSWRPLGDIAELASFFEVVEAANAARRAQATQASPPSSSANKVGGNTQLIPTPPQVALSDLSAPGAPSPTPTPTPTPPTQTGSLPSKGPRSPLAPPRGASSDVHTPPPTELKRTPTVVPTPPAAEVGFYASAVDELDDEDPVAAWGKRARRRNAALVVVALLVLGSAALFFLARPTFDRLVASGSALIGLEPKTSADGSASQDLTARVDSSLRTGSGDAPLFEELTEAAAPDDVPAQMVAALSRLHAAAAMRALDEQKLLQARPTSDDVTAALADAKKRGDEHLAQAYSLAGRARSAAPELADADLAFAAYQAAKGAALEASADIEAARRHAAGDPRVAHETAVLSSLAAAAAANDDEGRSAAKALVAKAGQGLEQDARLDQALLVLSALSSGPKEERAATRAAAEAWQKAAPGDARPALVLALLGAEAMGASDDATKSAAGNESGGDDAEVGSAQPDDTAADDGEAPAAAGQPPSADDAASAKKEGPDYDTLMKRAEQSRIRERTSAALSLYKKAVNLRPRAAKPHVGMGWCYLDLDKTRAARDAFAHAIDLDSGLAEAHFGLAEALRYSGQKSAALRSYKRYLELAPSGPDAAVARNAIQNLE